MKRVRKESVQEFIKLNTISQKDVLSLANNEFK